MRNLNWKSSFCLLLAFALFYAAWQGMMLRGADSLSQWLLVGTCSIIGLLFSYLTFKALQNKKK